MLVYKFIILIRLISSVVWYLDPQHVITIARLFDQGTYDASRIIALAGPKLRNQDTTDVFLELTFLIWC